MLLNAICRWSVVFVSVLILLFLFLFAETSGRIVKGEEGNNGNKNLLPDILKFLYDNERLCGDVFAEPQWLPAQSDCRILCPVTRGLCLVNVDINAGGARIHRQKCRLFTRNCISELQRVLFRSTFVNSTNTSVTITTIGSTTNSNIKYHRALEKSHSALSPNSGDNGRNDKKLGTNTWNGPEITKEPLVPKLLGSTTLTEKGQNPDHFNQTTMDTAGDDVRNSAMNNTSMRLSSDFKQLEFRSGKWSRNLIYDFENSTQNSSYQKGYLTVGGKRNFTERLNQIPVDIREQDTTAQEIYTSSPVDIWQQEVTNQRKRSQMPMDIREQNVTEGAMSRGQSVLITGNEQAFEDITAYPGTLRGSKSMDMDSDSGKGRISSNQVKNQYVLQIPSFDLNISPEISNHDQRNPEKNRYPSSSPDNEQSKTNFGISNPFHGSYRNIFKTAHKRQFIESQKLFPEGFIESAQKHGPKTAPSTEPSKLFLVPSQEATTASTREPPEHITVQRDGALRFQVEMVKKVPPEDSNKSKQRFQGSSRIPQRSQEHAATSSATLSSPSFHHTTKKLERGANATSTNDLFDFRKNSSLKMAKEEFHGAVKLSRAPNMDVSFSEVHDDTFSSVPSDIFSSKNSKTTVNLTKDATSGSGLDQRPSNGTSKLKVETSFGVSVYDGTIATNKTSNGTVSSSTRSAVDQEYLLVPRELFAYLQAASRLVQTDRIYRSLPDWATQVPAVVPLVISPAEVPRFQDWLQTGTTGTSGIMPWLQVGPTTASGTATSTIMDQNIFCCKWALEGLCDRSWQRIRQLCKKSCGTLICSSVEDTQSCSRLLNVDILKCYQQIENFYQEMTADTAEIKNKVPIDERSMLNTILNRRGTAFRVQP